MGDSVVNGAGLESALDASPLRKYQREYIMAHPSVKRMAYRMIMRRGGSCATLNSYVQGVMRFSRFVGYGDPESLLDAVKSGKVNVNKSLDEDGTGYIDHMLTEGEPKSGRKRGGPLSASTVHSDMAGLKKWLEVNEVTVDFKSIETPSVTQRVETDRAPTKEELQMILNASSLRDKAIITLLATSGLRVGTALSLKWGDLDFDYSNPDVVRIDIKRQDGRKFSNRNGRSQANLFVSWASPEAKTLLRQYRGSREATGEKITDESPLFVSKDKRRRFAHPPRISESGFSWDYANILRRANLNQKGDGSYYQLHINTLRKFFRSNCIGVEESYREHWMTHKGGYLDPSYFRAHEKEHLAQYTVALPHLAIFDSGQGAETESLRRRLEIAENSHEADIQRVKVEVRAEFKSMLDDLKTAYGLDRVDPDKPKEIHFLIKKDHTFTSANNFDSGAKAKAEVDRLIADLRQLGVEGTTVFEDTSDPKPQKRKSVHRSTTKTFGEE